MKKFDFELFFSVIFLLALIGGMMYVAYKLCVAGLNVVFWLGEPFVKIALMVAIVIYIFRRVGK